MKNPAACRHHRPGGRELLLAVLAASALLFAYSSWLACKTARGELFRAEMATVRLADSVAEFQQSLVTHAGQMLNIVGGITLSRKNLAACDDFLARQLDIFPAFENLAFVDETGKVTCSARAQPILLPATLPQTTSDKPLLHSLGPDRLAFIVPRKVVNGNKRGWIIAALPAGTLFQAASPEALFGLAHDGELISVHPAANAHDNPNSPYSGLMRAIGLSAATPVTTRDGTEWLHAAPVKGCANELSLLARLPSDAAAGKVVRAAALMGIAVILAGFLLWTLGRRIIPWLASIDWRHPDLAARIRQAAHSLYKKLRRIEWHKARSASGLTGITELRIAYEKLKHSFANQTERTRQIALLGELSQALQGCVNSKELADLIERAALALYPHCRGALLLKGASEVVQLEHAWGDSNHEEAFPCQDCWALRIGRPYHCQQAGAASCMHVRENDQDYICLPLIANGEILGVLHLSGLGAGATKAGIPWAAKSVAERTAIAISVVRREERLMLRATRDALTGIYNRRFMEEALAIEQSRAERRGSSIGLMMLDVDFFKRFNDTFGHGAGDALLRGIGRLLRRAMREGDMPCRYGGEEFVIILPGADLEHTRQRAEAIRTAIERWTPQQEGHAFGQVTVSIGIAAFPFNGIAWQAVLKMADEALYTAKHGGRNRVAAPV